MIHAASEGNSFVIEVKRGLVSVDGNPVLSDINPLPDGRWYILHGNFGYTAELISEDAGTFRIRINGRDSVVTLQTELEKRLAAMGFQNRHRAAISSVLAPMPGLITSVKVATGDKVVQGTPLLVLEAMKMENVLQSPVDGTVSAVRVNLGDRVEQGQSLVEF